MFRKLLPFRMAQHPVVVITTVVSLGRNPSWRSSTRRPLTFVSIHSCGIGPDANARSAVASLNSASRTALHADPRGAKMRGVRHTPRRSCRRDPLGAHHSPES